MSQLFAHNRLPCGGCWPFGGILSTKIAANLTSTARGLTADLLASLAAEPRPDGAEREPAAGNSRELDANDSGPRSGPEPGAARGAAPLGRRPGAEGGGTKGLSDRAQRGAKLPVCPRPERRAAAPTGPLPARGQRRGGRGERARAHPPPGPCS